MTIEAPIHPQETQRLASLRALDLLDTPLDVRFERITRMVRSLMGVPIAIFNLIDEDRQHYKSVQGLDAIDAPKPAAFCTHALLENPMLLVPDTSKDNRFCKNPFVTGELLNIGFYAGCPVHAPDGMPIGTLCAIDTSPREMTADQLRSLRDLADVIETELKVTGLNNSQKSLIAELDAAKRLAMIDPLTRLWNRAGIEALLEKESSEAVRNNLPLTIAMADIDHFKKINDTYGHPAGDAVLRAVAKRLVDGLRGEDIIGRYGGEEFIIILNEKNHDSKYNALERLRQSIESKPIEHEGKEYFITMSFGAATDILNDHKSTSKLIDLADEALYRAKNSGRNCVKIAEVMSDLARYSQSMRN